MPGGWGRPDCQKTALTTFLFSFKSSTYFTVLQRVSNCILKKTIISQGFRRGSNIFQGRPTFSRGGGGGQMPNSIETHITCDFCGGPDPLSPSGSAHECASSQCSKV